MLHDGVSIEWSHAAFKNKQGKELNATNNIFDEINLYWGQLPKPRQDQIFSLYLRVKETFENTENTKELKRTLTPLVSELYTLHPIEELDHWMRFRSEIRIPERIGEKFEDTDDPSKTRMKTYTREDYQKLIVLALALRAIVPIWGELIAYTEKHKILGTHWKEYSAYQLLARTSLMYCEAMVKLRGYVTSFIPTEKSKRPHSAILAGVGSEDFPEWLLGVIVFRRVSIGDIRNNNPESHLVSSIHSYIQNRLSPSETSFIGPVREKVNRRGEEDENKISRLEGYKIREEQSGGDIAMIIRGVEDPYVVARHVSKTVPLELVEQALASTHVLMNVPIQEPQTKIMQFVLEAAIQPLGLQNPEKPLFVKCLAVAQAILWHNGHLELAGLVSAKAELGDADQIEVGMGGHGRISKDLVEQLNIHYPFPLRPSSKSQKETGRTQNVAVVNIDWLTKQLDQFGWTLTLPTAMVRQVNPDTTTRRYVLPTDIRNKLALFAIAVATRSF